jgi:hypothetical protein
MQISSKKEAPSGASFLVEATGFRTSFCADSLADFGNKQSAKQSISAKWRGSSSSDSIEKSADKASLICGFLVGMFIPDLLKGKEPRRTKHIPKVPETLVFTRNFEPRKEYDYGKVHH